MPLHSTAIEDVDRYELAAILAGLRLLQQTPTLPTEIEKIATDCNEFTPLDPEQIDALCERINAVSEYPWRDVTDDDDTGAMEARVASLFSEEAQVSEEDRAEEALAQQLREGGV